MFRFFFFWHQERIDPYFKKKIAHRDEKKKVMCLFRLKTIPFLGSSCVRMYMVTLFCTVWMWLICIKMITAQKIENGNDSRVRLWYCPFFHKKNKINNYLVPLQPLMFLYTFFFFFFWYFEILLHQDSRVIIETEPTGNNMKMRND